MADCARVVAVEEGVEDGVAAACIGGEEDVRKEWSGGAGGGRMGVWRGRVGGKKDIPSLVIVCIAPRGKTVILPGVRSVVRGVAPFSMTMNVFVVPDTATTILVDWWL